MKRINLLTLLLLVIGSSVTSLRAQTGTYCTPVLGNTAGDYINAFSTTGGATNITNPNNGIAPTNGYIFYNTMTHTGIQGTTFGFSGTVGSWASSEYAYVWVDWNQDGDFLDAQEEVYNSVTPLTGGAFAPFSGTGNIPIFALPGITRLRVMNTYFTVGSPCNTNGAGLGETEDYNFMVIPATPCSGTPNAGVAVANPTAPCSGAPVTLSVTGSTVASGITYQWQTSTTASGPWTNFGSAGLSPTLNTVASTPLYYRAVVTCGTLSANSTPVLVAVPVLFPAGTYTINATLPSSATNFQSFGAAISAISCGTAGPVVFNVNNATYNEQINVPVINTNSATNTITFNGNGATVTFAGSSSLPHTIGLNGADWFRFNDISFVGTDATYAIVGHLWNGADNNMFTSCNFLIPVNNTSFYTTAFSISGSASSATTSGLAGSNNIIDGCTMRSGYYNTTIIGNTGAMATNNQIRNCHLVDFYYYGLYQYYADGTVFSGNELDRPTRASNVTFYGVYLSSPSTNNLFEKNRFHDPFGSNPVNANSAYCIYSFAPGVVGGENKFFNNTFYNINCNGSIYGIYNASNNYTQIYHNTLNFDNATATGTGTIYGIYATGTTGVNIRNNIVNITQTGTGTKYCLYYSGTKVSNNNDLYMGSPAGTRGVGYYGALRITLADFQLASGLDGASVSLDPVFTNPAGGDLKPNNLGMDNLGAATPVATDITNAPRLNPPDIGAFEFGSGCPSVTGLAVSAINANGATFNWVAPTGGASGYQYVINQSASDPVIPGTSVAGTTLTVNNLLPLTSYYFHVRVVCPGGGFSFWKNVFFNTPCKIPSGALRLSGDSILCPNQAITLSTDTAYNVAYQWLLNGTPIPGATSASYATSTDGTYSVVSTQGTCTKTSTSVRLKTDSTLIATVTYAGLPTACDGGRITLTANSGSGFTYEWLKNGAVIPTANSSVYVAEYTGTYQVRIRAAAECPAVSSPIAVVIHPAPFPQITRSGNVLSTTVPYASYQWYKGVNALLGETGPTYTFVNDGNFSVKVVDTNTCAASSAAFPVNFLGIGAVSGSEVSVYPNPATDVVMISSPVAVKVVIRSMDGKTVMESAVGAAKMDVRGLSNGLYLINILDRDNHLIKTEKLTKTNR